MIYKELGGNLRLLTGFKGIRKFSQLKFQFFEHAACRINKINFLGHFESFPITSRVNIRKTNT